MASFWTAINLPMRPGGSAHSRCICSAVVRARCRPSGVSTSLDDVARSLSGPPGRRRGRASSSSDSSGGGMPVPTLTSSGSRRNAVRSAVVLSTVSDSSVRAAGDVGEVRRRVRRRRDDAADGVAASPHPLVDEQLSGRARPSSLAGAAAGACWAATQRVELVRAARRSTSRPMLACCSPQNSAHSPPYTPGSSASITRVFVPSGRTSSLPCRSGTQKLWMTSAEISRSSTGSPTGTWISLATVTSSARYCADHQNW